MRDVTRYSASPAASSANNNNGYGSGLQLHTCRPARYHHHSAKHHHTNGTDSDKMARRMGIPRSPHGTYTNVPKEAEHQAASALFDQFCAANTLQGVMSTFQQLCDVLGIRPQDHKVLYLTLKTRLNSWKAQSLWAKLDKRSTHREYKKATCCTNTRVLIIGGGPCGLRTAIEVALLGGKAVVLEKRDRFSRNSVLHLWPFLIHDLKALGAKKFFGKFCAGAIDHVSIRTLQCILIKVALLVGVEVHLGVTYDSLQEPPENTAEKVGWRANVTPKEHPVSEFEFDVLIGADGKRNTVKGFKRKEFRGKLAIAITANFINRHTQAEAQVEEISGVAYIFNQKFFKDLNQKTGIDLENIVYYKDETHYFIMTAKKHSLLDKGVLIQDFEDPARLLSKDNVSQVALESYAREAADVSTGQQLPNLDLAHNHYGQPDIAMFDFTSIYHAVHASRVIEKSNYRLLVGLAGDSLLEPFWPIGSGCARGFLGALDAAWMIRCWASAKKTPLEVIAERESIYQLLSQTTPENISKNYHQYSINPSSRYPNLNWSCVRPHQVKNLYTGADPEYINKIVMISEQNSKRYELIRDSHFLLKWFQRQIESYHSLVRVTDLSSSWRSGLALCALIHKYFPELMPIYTLDPNQVAENNQRAFDIAEKELGIKPVFTGKEMAVSEEPDSMVMLNYLFKFYEYLRKESIRPAKIAKTPEKDKKLKVPSKSKSRSPRSPSSKLAFLNRLGHRNRQRRDDEGNEKENGEHKHVLTHSTARKRLKEMSTDNKVLKSYNKFEDGRDDIPSRLANVRKKMQHRQQLGGIDAGIRGQNKVSALAKDLAQKFKAENTPPEAKKMAPKPLIMGKAQPVDLCYFCHKKVYLVEKHTAEGLVFHRGCFRCDYCASNLRIGAYAFERVDNEEAKFFCFQHQGMKKPEKRPRKRSHGDKQQMKDSRNVPPSFSPPRVHLTGQDEADSQVGALKKTPERIEYVTESEQEESEFDQTAHNLSGNLGDLNGDDSDSSDSSDDELEWSDDELSDPDTWAELARSYNKQIKSTLHRRIPVGSGSEDDDSSTETETVGGSDADYETDDETESDYTERDSDDVYSEEEESEKIILKEKTSTPISIKDDKVRKKLNVALSPLSPVEAKPSPTSQEIMRNRMAFFNAVSEPVRIDARSFLGLRLPSPEPEEEEKKESEETPVGSDADDSLNLQNVTSSEEYMDVCGQPISVAEVNEEGMDEEPSGSMSLQPIHQLAERETIAILQEALKEVVPQPQRAARPLSLVKSDIDEQTLELAEQTSSTILKEAIEIVTAQSRELSEEDLGSTTPVDDIELRIEEDMDQLDGDVSSSNLSALLTETSNNTNPVDVEQLVPLTAEWVQSKCQSVDAKLPDVEDEKIEDALPSGQYESLASDTSQNVSDAEISDNAKLPDVAPEVTATEESIVTAPIESVNAAPTQPSEDKSKESIETKKVLELSEVECAAVLESVSPDADIEPVDREASVTDSYAVQASSSVPDVRFSDSISISDKQQAVQAGMLDNGQMEVLTENTLCSVGSVMSDFDQGRILARFDTDDEIGMVTTEDEGTIADELTLKDSVTTSSDEQMESNSDILELLYGQDAAVQNTPLQLAENVMSPVGVCDEDFTEPTCVSPAGERVLSEPIDVQIDKKPVMSAVCIQQAVVPTSPSLNDVSKFAETNVTDEKYDIPSEQNVSVSPELPQQDVCDSEPVILTPQKSEVAQLSTEASDMPTEACHVPSSEMNVSCISESEQQSVLGNLNLHPLEVVSRYRDPQLQVDENYSDVPQPIDSVVVGKSVTESLVDEPTQLVTTVVSVMVDKADNSVEKEQTPVTQVDSEVPPADITSHEPDSSPVIHQQPVCDSNVLLTIDDSAVTNNSEQMTEESSDVLASQNEQIQIGNHAEVASAAVNEDAAVTDTSIHVTDIQIISEVNQEQQCVVVEEDMDIDDECNHSVISEITQNENIPMTPVEEHMQINNNRDSSDKTMKPIAEDVIEVKVSDVVNTSAPMSLEQTADITSVDKVNSDSICSRTSQEDMPMKDNGLVTEMSTTEKQGNSTLLESLSLLASKNQSPSGEEKVADLSEIVRGNANQLRADDSLFDTEPSVASSHIVDLKPLMFSSCSSQEKSALKYIEKEFQASNVVSSTPTHLPTPLSTTTQSPSDILETPSKDSLSSIEADAIRRLDLLMESFDSGKQKLSFESDANEGSLVQFTVDGVDGETSISLNEKNITSRSKSSVEKKPSPTDSSSFTISTPSGSVEFTSSLPELTSGQTSVNGVSASTTAESMCVDRLPRAGTEDSFSGAMLNADVAASHKTLLSNTISKDSLSIDELASGHGDLSLSIDHLADMDYFNDTDSIDRLLETNKSTPKAIVPSKPDITNIKINTLAVSQTPKSHLSSSLPVVNSSHEQSSLVEIEDKETSIASAISTPLPSINSTATDDSIYFTPNTSGVEPMDLSEDLSLSKSISSSDRGAESKSLGTLSDTGTISDISDQRSLSSLKADFHTSPVCSPNKLVDAKRKFFFEVQQPVRIDHKYVLREFPNRKNGQNGLKTAHGNRDGGCVAVSQDSPDDRQGFKTLELKQDWKGMQSTTPTSPTAAIPHRNSVSGESDLFFTPGTSVKSKPEVKKERGGNAKKPLPVGPDKTKNTKTTVKAVDARSKDKAKKPELKKSASKESRTSESKLGLLSKAMRRPGSAKPDTQRQYSAPAGSTTPTSSITPLRITSPYSDDARDSESSPVGIRKDKKNIDKRKVKIVNPPVEKKKRSLFAMLMPAKSFDRREPEKRETTPEKVMKEKSKSLPRQRAQDQVQDRKSAVRIRAKSPARSGDHKKMEVDSRRSMYDEFAPIMEDICSQQRRGKESMQEKIEAVAPPPAKAPHTTLRPPKATVEDFDTGSEFGDDSISLRSFHAQQVMNEEDRAKYQRRQQKQAARRLKEAEQRRLRMAQEIQRHLEEVEIKQREIEEKGVAIERALRGEGPDASRDEAELMQEWFNIVHEKNVLVRYDSELMVHARELELEDRHSRLEQQLRERITLDDEEFQEQTENGGLKQFLLEEAARNGDMAEEEQQILEELLEVVEQRDALVKLLEENRRRDEQRIRDLKKMLNSKGFELSPVDYLKKMRLPSLRDLQTLDDSR